MSLVEKKGISLKLKLVVLITGLTTSMLALFAFISLRDFEKDKLAYIYDTNQAHVRSSASQVKSEITHLVDKIKSVTFSYYKSKKVHLSKSSPFAGFWIYDWRRDDYRLKVEKFSMSKKNLPLAEMTDLKEELIQEALQSEVSLRRVPSEKGLWLMSLKLKAKSISKRPIVVLGLVQREGLLDAFSGYHPQNTYLIDRNGKILLEAESPPFAVDSQVLNQFLRDLVLQDNPVHVFEHKFAKDKSWLVSAAKSGVGGFRAVALVPKSAALQVVQLLALKALIFLGLLISLTIGVGVIASHGLTATLRKLLEATRLIGQGQFDVDLQVKSNDEVGTLAKGFNLMTREIKRLMLETAEKARMEGELQTAQTVQSTLFPKEDLETDQFAIHGFYEPASECGGDWWYYNQSGDHLYLWIGDATGHGVPAALVTSAAKSAASIIEQMPKIELDKVVELMNNAIYATAGGKVLMTFLVGRYDINTGELEYCNASHDPPFMFPDQPNLKKNDLIPILGSSGPRLGQQKDSKYSVDRLQIKSGEKLLFYTDGVTECIKGDGAMFGERKMLMNLAKAFSAGKSSKEAVEGLWQGLSEYRGDEILADDVTYFVLERKDTEQLKVAV